MSPTTTPTGRKRPAARVAFVGTGPGDPRLLTLAAVEALAAADAIVTDQLTALDVVRSHACPDAEIVDASHGTPGQALTHASRAKLVVATAKAHPGGLVVRLMDGDPATFNGLAEEAIACQKAGIAFEIVPGVTAATAVPAYAGIPLTGAAVTGVHVLAPGQSGIEWAAYADPATTVVLLGTAPDLETGAQALLAAGRDPKTLVALTEHGTTTRQRTQVCELRVAARTVAGLGFPTLAILGPTVPMREHLSWFESKPLFGWRVLIPRTMDQAQPVLGLLAGHGAHGEIVPTISVEPPRTRHQMDKAIRGLVTGSYEWIGFTSVNAVKAVRELFEEIGLDARALAGLKVAAVGGVTAEALRAWGIRPDLVPSGEASARGLVAEWPEYDADLDPINKVFLPRADIATDTLVAGLEDLGWSVEAVTAYRTVRAAPPKPEVRESIKGGDFDAVVFTSSSTVRNLVGIAGKPHASTIVACIGPATAKTAEDHGLRVDVLAPEASVPVLIEALADFGRGRAAAALEAGEVLRRPSEKRRSTARRRARS
ncbi:MAG: uroporphyrinogen-III synthase [Actinobacteria bacterium]|uniref:Bifunctional uroporphyrinogen-III C-methyltransferase/uroporphyrinogen-III synthase n=1 Tax=Nostocoides veronense TaxID=330836 RepID=A0ABN2LAF8_9MICO|nr:uroporphyrinogen-III synthase [Actinomycetota bacterium]